jgi:hypothetical protein
MDCTDLTGRNIGICVEGMPRGTIKKQVEFIRKSCRILRGFQIWILFLHLSKRTKCFF